MLKIRYGKHARLRMMERGVSEMEKKCPICGSGKLKKGEIEEEMFGISLGRYDAEICDMCGESFVDKATMRAIEQKAKELGIWGIAKKIKVVRSGDSLAIRIPADIAKLFNLHEGKEIFFISRGNHKTRC